MNDHHPGIQTNAYKHLRTLLEQLLKCHSNCHIFYSGPTGHGVCNKAHSRVVSGVNVIVLYHLLTNPFKLERDFLNAYCCVNYGRLNVNQNI